MSKQTTKTGNVSSRSVGRQPHENVQGGRRAFADNRTGQRSPFPPAQLTKKPGFPDNPIGGPLKPGGDSDLNRGAARTGTTPPPDRVNQNGEFPGGSKL